MVFRKALQPILMVDDDPDDRIMVEKAFLKNRVSNPILFLSDGEELLNYLERRGPFASPEVSPRPGFILLDLNMPKIDGRKALGLLKTDPELRKIPVVVWTTSRSEEDIARCYSLGANSYITKPVNFDGLMSLMACIKTYWLEITELPPPDTAGIG